MCALCALAAVLLSAEAVRSTHLQMPINVYILPHHHLRFFQVLYFIRVRFSFSASLDVLPLIASGVCVMLQVIFAVVANKLQLRASVAVLQALAALVVVFAVVPMLVHWGARGESGGGLQMMMPLRMIVFVMIMNLDWMPGALCLVLAAFVAAMVVALKCSCDDWSLLVVVNCIVCAAVMVERWCW